MECFHQVGAGSLVLLLIDYYKAPAVFMQVLFLSILPPFKKPYRFAYAIGARMVIMGLH